MQDITSKAGALWVQPDGPNTPVYFLECHGLEEIAEAMGGIELLRSFKPDGSGWEVTGQTVSPPDPVTFSVATRLKSTRSWMQKLDCAFSFYALQRDCGRADEFNNYVRGDILQACRVVDKAKGPLADIEEDNPSDLSVDVEAWPPVVEIPNLVIDMLTPDALAVTGAYCAVPNMDRRCYGDCGDKLAKGEHVVMVGESGAILQAEIEFSSDSGATFTDTVADPFAAGAGVFSGTRFPMGRDGYRWLAWKETEAGTQGEIAYCDDLTGAAWTAVNIGGAAAAEGSAWGQGCFSLHGRFIFIAGANGSIWKSTDYGLTWTQVEPGRIHAGNYNCIHFANEYFGVAGGAADVIAVTTDGGVTWSAATATGGGGDIQCCWQHDKNRIWVGTDDGDLYFSRDGGTSWTSRTGWDGAGVGSVNGMSWYDDHYGFIVSDTAAPVGTILRTINGGYDWAPIETPSNSGLTHIACVAPDLAYGTGLAHGGASVYFKVRESA